MNGDDRPTCWIIAGPNGAGNTTFALKYLPEAGCQNFVNADLIAAGMSPLAPDRELIVRRFRRSIENLFGAYASLVDRTVCFLNSGEMPEIVFTQQGERCEVKQPVLMQLLQDWRRT